MRKGFTVLEVLLAMVLSMALLAGLWTALSTFMRAFESGRSEVEQTQLVRALFTKLSDDLRRTVPQGKITVALQTNDADAVLPLPSPLASDTDNLSSTDSEWPPGASDQASLVGTAHQLRLRVCRPGINRDNTPLDSLELNVVRLPDDLQTVYYWLARGEGIDASAGSAAGSFSGLGLVRRERGWFRWRDPNASMTGMNGADGLSAENDLLQFEQALLPEENLEQPDESLLVATEVGELRFQYLDGSTWTDRWDSGDRGGLPKAVEISLYLRRDEDDQRPVTATSTTSANGTQEIPADYRQIVIMKSEQPPRVATTPTTADSSVPGASDLNSPPITPAPSTFTPEPSNTTTTPN